VREIKKMRLSAYIKKVVEETRIVRIEANEKTKALFGSGKTWKRIPD
jgi:hypothetical protein